jgi:transcriptional regulator with GAF, ATPase, and Fis domain
VLMVFSARTPTLEILPLVDGRLELGRAMSRGDDLMSRRHALITHVGGRWSVKDLGSRNGTHVDGRAVAAETETEAQRGVVRLGGTLFLLRDTPPSPSDLRVTVNDEGVVGPRFGEALAAVRRAAASAQHLLLTGESGTGKERLAREFHAAGPQAQGPWIAVNCAAIPESIAERLLFGATRGTYTGADADAAGYIAAADGGTLFLDEIGDLPAPTQAKLLRALETHEILPLGASRARRVRTRFCFATLAELRGSPRFRQDLYFRIAQHVVQAPALRDRPEEIPWLIAWQLDRVEGTLRPHARFVERCLLATWPGNVRELLAVVRRAADQARLAGAALVTATGLDPVTPEPQASVSTGGGDEAASAAETPEEIMRSAILAALEKAGWRVSGERGAARLLGLKPTTLESRMKQLGIERPGARGGGDGED